MKHPRQLDRFGDPEGMRRMTEKRGRKRLCRHVDPMKGPRRRARLNGIDQENILGPAPCFQERRPLAGLLKNFDIGRGLRFESPCDDPSGRIVPTVVVSDPDDKDL